MDMTDMLAEYIIEDPALEGQNIDAIKTRFDAYTNIYKQAKKKARHLSSEKDYGGAAEEYKKAGKALAETASTVMKIKDDDVSLVIGHVVGVTKDIAQGLIQYGAMKAAGTGLYSVAGKVANRSKDAADLLYFTGDIGLGQNPYLTAAMVAIKEMLRLSESYKMSKKKKNIQSTNPIRKQTATALIKMSQEMYRRAAVEKKKASKAK